MKWESLGRVLIESAKQIAQHMRGEIDLPMKVVRVVPGVDVRAIREGQGLTREQFAERYPARRGAKGLAVPLRENGSMSDRLTTINPVKTFKQFVTAVNSHDVRALTALMTADHVFVDSVGNRVCSAASMEVGWRGYFAMCPDYWIQTDHVMAEGGAVLAVGEAGGTIDGVSWRTPAAWQAVIRDGKVVEWRVFADNKPVYEILARRQQQRPARKDHTK